MSSYNHFGCKWCGGPFNGGNFPSCSSVRSGNEFVYDPNSYPYNDTPDFYDQPPQHQFKTYSCESCGGDPHYGFDCQTRAPLVFDEPYSYNDFDSSRFDQPPQHPIDLSPFHDDMSLPEIVDYFDDEDDDDTMVTITLPPAIALPLPLLTTMNPADTVLMGDKDSSTTPARETDQFNESSTGDLVPILRESKVTSDDDSECDMLNISLPTTDVREDNFVTFSNPLFDTSCYDNSLYDEEFEDISSLGLSDLTPAIDETTLLVTPTFMTFSNPLFNLNDDSTLGSDNLLFDKEFKDISSFDPSY
ncbi:hypothetical protein Tco_1390132 [Tanacetum coccineum]